MTGAERQRRRRVRLAKITLDDMWQHAERLCAEHDIVWQLTRRKACALREFQEIMAPPIRGAVSYATVLHEIGHILGRHQQSRHVMILESWAWRWARENALVWTPSMERCARKSLEWYAPRAAKIDRKRADSPTADEQLDGALGGDRGAR